MTESSAWRCLAAFPMVMEGDCRLEPLVRTALAHGYALHEVDIEERDGYLRLMVYANEEAAEADRDRAIVDHYPETVPPLHVEFGPRKVELVVREQLEQLEQLEASGGVLEPEPRTEPDPPEAFVPAPEEPAPEGPARVGMPFEPYRPPGRVQCVDCDGWYAAGAGITAHRRHKHPDSAEARQYRSLNAPAPPEPAGEPVAPPTALETARAIAARSDELLEGAERKEDWPRPYCGPKEPMLVCEDCDDWYTNGAVTLALHVRKRHNREPTVRERTPVDDETRAAMFAKTG